MLIFLFAAKSSRERPPTFLTPEGSKSTKEELRGNVLSLECIAEGLWVNTFCSYVHFCFFFHFLVCLRGRERGANRVAISRFMFQVLQQPGLSQVKPGARNSAEVSTCYLSRCMLTRSQNRGVAQHPNADTLTWNTSFLTTRPNA